jgi:GNAT superfamily N-acetyltransferase
MNGRFTIEEFDGATLAEPRRRALFRLSRAVGSELRQPPGPREDLGYRAFSRRLSAPAHGLHDLHWAALSSTGRTAAGWARLTLRQAADFEGAGKFHIEVSPAYRRLGLGTALLGRVRERAELLGLSTLYGWAADSSAGSGFLSARLDRVWTREISSVLDLCRIDRDAIRHRAGRLPVPGVEPAGWAGSCPPGLLEEYARCHRRTNADARGSEAGPEQVTAALLAEQEGAAERSGQEWITVAAVGPGGELLGFSQADLPADRSGRAQQVFTGVVPEHNGRGIAGWLKASVVVRLMKHKPRVRWLTTENNGANPAILAANARLGFEPYLTSTGWESTLKETR